MRCSLGPVVLISLLALPLPAQAWESDVHYGLTRWLAQQTGFSDEQSKWIADGDQGVDDSPITDPVHSTIASACTGADKTGSSEVHDHHFPSKNGVPDTPKQRVVEPGLVQRQGSVNPAPRLSDRPSTFNDFGKYLHALQDTWSHQGIPDFPDPPCDQQLGWGHALARGGWACHLADLTYMWQAHDVPETAKATYDEMVAQSPGSPKPWKDLEPTVAEFAAARSKWEKDDWFRKQGFSDRELGFLQEISLPDCTADAPRCPGPYPFQHLLETWTLLVRLNSNPTGRERAPSDVQQAFRDFVTGLVTEGKNFKTDLIDSTLSRIALTRALHVSNACPELVDQLLNTLLGPGIMSGWAAHQPIELCEAAYQATLAGSGQISCAAAIEALQRARILRYGPDIREIAPAAQAQGLPLFLLSTSFNPRSESYYGFVRFIHLPRDILVLTARRISGAAKIVGAVWSPDQ
jgi:hypothetical protein